jgi:hypothetical protein
MKKRKSGFYRVMFGECWIVAQYFADSDIWQLMMGGISVKKDSDFEKIDERRIEFGKETIELTKAEIKTLIDDVGVGHCVWSDTSYKIIRFIGEDPTAGT